LDDWLKENGIDPKDRECLITHAGEVLGFNNAEIFVHSPFSFKMENEEVDRNGACLVFHVTFFEGSTSTRLMLGSDAEHESWDSIIIKTLQKKSPERLVWDIFRISHHCSYTALSPEKGKDKTEPLPSIDKMFINGDVRSYLVSSSWPIDSDIEPPHKQAANYYRGLDGEFLVTMEEPNKRSPKPIEFEITDKEHRKLLLAASGVIPAITSKASSKQG